MTEEFFKTGRTAWRQPMAGEHASAVFLGDYCPDAAAERRFAEGEIAAVFGAVKPFTATAELKIIQWETPMAAQAAPIAKCGPNLNCTPAAAGIIPFLNIDVALLANNHIGDHGPAAAAETIEKLHRAGAATVGAGRNAAEAARPLLIERNNIRIALLNWGENEFGFTTGERPGANPMALLRNLAAIRAAAAEADQVWVAVHGGHEYNPFPSPRMQETYRAYIEAGAKAVFNCHTHCPIGIELYRDAPIVYSPGNFYFPGFSDRPPVWYLGYLPKLEFDRAGVFALEIEPIIFRPELVRPLIGPERAAFFAYFKELHAPLADPAELQKYFEAWSAHYGQTHLAQVLRLIGQNFPPDENPDPDLKLRWMKLRNLISCESHCDKLNCYLRLLEEERRAPALAGLPRLQGLQAPDWLEALLTRGDEETGL